MGPFQRLAVLTSDVDSPGMNAAVRAVVRRALYAGWTVWGIRDGFAGLLRGDMIPMDSRSVSHIIEAGGTFLGTSPGRVFQTPYGLRDALARLNERGIDALVVVGGQEGLHNALTLAQAGFPTVGIPASIENDLPGTSVSIGVDTALNTAIDAIDRIQDTALAQEQAYVIEVAGRRSGYLALMAGLAGGAEVICIPESPYTCESVAQEAIAAYTRGKRHCLIVVAEGATPDARALKAHMSAHQEEIGFPTEIVMLGHILRGGAPTARDRVLATRLGALAVECLIEGQDGVMVGMQEGKPCTVPLKETLGRPKALDTAYLALAHALAR